MSPTKGISRLLSLAILWSSLAISNGFSAAIATPLLSSYRRLLHSANPSAVFLLARSTFPSILLRLATSNDDNASDEESSNNKEKKKGDSLRRATGIRSSLHPTTINCIAEALMLRSSNNKTIQIDVANPNVEPLQVAIAAGEIAMKAIDKRNSASEKDDDASESFTMGESQTISGRVVGVVMRMRELENMLRSRVKGVGWVIRYGEEGAFGLLRDECCLCSDDDDDGLELGEKVAETIKINPLFRMNRAECLLALFLDTVERPKLELLDEGVAGGSAVDFIDADRLKVLRSS